MYDSRISKISKTIKETRTIMNWSTFVEDYNELTALSFDHLYHYY